MVDIAIGVTLLAIVVAVWAIAKWNDREYKKWRDWYDNLPPDEQRKVQEELYKDHIYRG